MKNKPTDNHGIIKYKNVDFHYYTYGYRYGRGIAVYKQYLNSENEIVRMNKFTTTFSFWDFDPKEEALNIIKEHFNLLNK